MVCTSKLSATWKSQLSRPRFNIKCSAARGSCRLVDASTKESGMESAYRANHQRLPTSAAVMCLEASTYTPEEECLTGHEQEGSDKINKAESNDPKGDGGKSSENESSPPLFCVEGSLGFCRLSEHTGRITEPDGGWHYGVLLHPAAWNLERGDEEPDYASIPEVASSVSSPYKNACNAVSSPSELKGRKLRSSIIAFSDYGSQAECTPSETTELYICEASDELYGPTSEDNFTELPHNMGYFMRKRKRATSGKQNNSLSSGNTTLSQLGKYTEISEKDSQWEQEEIGKEDVPYEDVFRWTDSMTLLMRKLDQLNLDIEDALSVSPSPASTPVTKRRQGHQQPALPLKLSQETAEIEAKEACDWLRAAGFPQYAQLYEDSQFPIDIASVKKDHDFLDKDFIEPLCRRLNTLNKCTSMKIDVNLPKKKGQLLEEQGISDSNFQISPFNCTCSCWKAINLKKTSVRSEDSDEDDLCAISDKWTFQRSSKRWSRLDDIDVLFPRQDSHLSAGGMKLKNTTSSESVLTDLSEPEVSSIHSESSGGSDSRSLAGRTVETNCATTERPESSLRNSAETTVMPDSTSLNSSFPQTPKDITNYSFGLKTEKNAKTKARNLLKRMETLRPRASHSKLKGSMRSGALVISSPVLQQEPESLKTMQCVEIVNGNLNNLAKDSTKSGFSSSTQSSSDSHSETSSSAVSTPCLKSRKRRFANKRSGMYLEDVDIMSGTTIKQVADQNRRNEFRSQENLVVHIPKDHKPGTFPKALSIESLSPTDNYNPVNWRTGSISLGKQKCSINKPKNCYPRGSRISIYDNVPGSHLYASTGDLMDLEKEDIFPHLDDILQHVNGLQQIVDHWSRNVLPEIQDDELSVCERQFHSSNQIMLDFERHSMSDGQTTPSDLDRDGHSLNESEAVGMRDRRDSGVGASLTRPSRRQRLRWHSFQISHRLSLTLASLQISNQSAAQLNLLQKFSLLRLTAIMEKYSMSNKHGWTWSVPKFMKRMKVPDYKDKNVFGVPLIVHVQRTGQPLPQSIQQAMRYLRSQCLDQVGLFRKSGAKSRIQALRQMNEASPDNVSYEDQCAYDVADMLKQFFRDLPDPLLTSKLGETFLHIYQYVPKEQRLQAVQAASMLMSDENREVLQTLLCFLSDVTSVTENQMTAMNLAVCLAPSLFHLNLIKKGSSSPRVMQRKYASGKPDQKDLNENLAATQGLAQMITECNKLFQIPQDMMTQSRNSYVEADAHPLTLEELGKQLEDEGANYQTYLENVIQNLQKEAREKFKGWVSCPCPDNTELAYKKVGDGHPLRLWKVSVEVEAPPSVVLNRVLRERHLWDDDLLQWKIIESLDKQTEIFQYVLNSMAPHPSRDFVTLRTWRTDLPKGTCALVAISIEHDEAPLVGGVRAMVMDSQCLIEPCGSGKSRMTHISRADLRGRTPEWYNKAFGYLCAADVARIRNSFQPIIAEGPETKI
uniref:stAR-related lipid transfer protein 13-like isoform X1 n=1 Tax=Pristiophorus japonicus TaxID=55135 RepID=UPI00398F305D